MPSKIPCIQIKRKICRAGKRTRIKIIIQKIMITPKFFATIEQGKVKHADPQAFQTYVIQKFKEGQEVEITIKRKFKRRTSGQPGEKTNFNGYFWFIMEILADELGYFDKRKVADDVLVEIGHTKMNRFGKMVAGETHDLEGAKFAELCSKIRMWASSEQNIYLPEPNEKNYECL
jgi:hypothetical protein